MRMTRMKKRTRDANCESRPFTVRLVEVESRRSFYYGTRIALPTAVPTLAPPAIWMSPHPEGEQPPRDRSVTTVCELRLFVGAGQGQLGAVVVSLTNLSGTSSHNDGAADGTTGLAGHKVRASVRREAAPGASVPARSADNRPGIHNVKIAVVA